VHPQRCADTTTLWGHFPCSQIDAATENSPPYQQAQSLNFERFVTPSTAEISSSLLISKADDLDVWKFEGSKISQKALVQKFKQSTLIL